MRRRKGKKCKKPSRKNKLERTFAQGRGTVARAILRTDDWADGSSSSQCDTTLRPSHLVPQGRDVPSSGCQGQGHDCRDLLLPLTLNISHVYLDDGCTKAQHHGKKQQCGSLAQEQILRRSLRDTAAVANRYLTPNKWDDKSLEYEGNRSPLGTSDRTVPLSDAGRGRCLRAKPENASQMPSKILFNINEVIGPGRLAGSILET
ncbi:hypothetical protein QBC43DRAFT_107171 [Cladorrhinum sp. PSN259]|nr:hypothetical protein QBC43DRAFT_107171 [Cladorrhinum sp. PSN259]